MSGSIESSAASAPLNMLWSSASTTRILCVTTRPPSPPIAESKAPQTHTPAARYLEDCYSIGRTRQFHNTGHRLNPLSQRLQRQRGDAYRTATGTKRTLSRCPPSVVSRSGTDSLGLCPSRTHMGLFCRCLRSAYSSGALSHSR